MKLKRQQQQHKTTVVVVANDTATTANNSNNERRGGRHGGAGTKKNVPYTRTGDQGTSQLFTGERRRKDDAAFEAMGAVDELCTFVGAVHTEISTATDNDNDVDYGELDDRLLRIMSRLFDLGSHVAKPLRRTTEEPDDSAGDSDGDSTDSSIGDTDDSDDDTERCPEQPRADNNTSSSLSSSSYGTHFDPDHVRDLECWIDDMTEALPELTSFVLPTGCRASTQLHVARTVCRRAERSVLCLVEDVHVCDPCALTYLNRLSDFLFSAARFTNYVNGHDEILYRRHVPTSESDDGGDEDHRNSNNNQRQRVVVKLRNSKVKP